MYVSLKYVQKDFFGLSFHKNFKFSQNCLKIDTSTFSHNILKELPNPFCPIVIVSGKYLVL